MNSEKIKEKITETGERSEELIILFEEVLQTFEAGGKDRVKDLLRSKISDFGSRAEGIKDNLLRD